ncbi:MarR family winged helix-turn-helix transcriptional regulator [Actinoallomurus acaciae]|uniref:MarR family winged helix-turn-helix transcriptional regulator n=1 Tax=Actinoallomurus acaciae TaxID=502577 RepID=A0ABV5Y8U9_9ACTN
MEETPPSLLALTPYLLSRVGKAARGRVVEQLAARGLRLWHMAVLAALADFGSQAQRDLATRLRIDPSDIVKILDDLAATGLAERARDPADRRRVTVTITSAGRTALRELTAGTIDVQEEIMAPLNEEERAVLHTLLRRLFTHLSEGDGQR